jgi:hypothetical protein
LAAALPVRVRPLTVTALPFATLEVAKEAVYPFVDNLTLAISSATTPARTTLLEMIAAVVVPS